MSTDFEKTILSATDEAKDRSAEIEAILREYGICRLSNGIYSVSRIVMPEKSMLLGSGEQTVLRDIGETGDSERNLIQTAAGSTIQNLRIEGKDYPIYEDVPEEDPEYLHTGFDFQPYYAQNVNHTNPTNGILVEIEPDSHVHTQVVRIQNVTVIGFSGCGIVVRKTGFFAVRSVQVENVQLSFNGIGLMTGELGEFGVYSNIIAGMNYIGVLNNGGNNKFSNCGIDRNFYGFVIEKSPNNAHGSVTGSSFNHNDNGAIHIKGTKSGFIFSGCNIFHGGTEDSPTVLIEDARAVSFTGCTFGGWKQNPLRIAVINQSEDITCGGAKFVGNTFMADPLVTVSGDATIYETGNVDRKMQEMHLN